jgi:hypothetical protein
MLSPIRNRLKPLNGVFVVHRPIRNTQLENGNFKQVVSLNGIGKGNRLLLVDDSL